MNQSKKSFEECRFSSPIGSDDPDKFSFVGEQVCFIKNIDPWEIPGDKFVSPNECTDGLSLMQLRWSGRGRVRALTRVDVNLGIELPRTIGAVSGWEIAGLAESHEFPPWASGVRDAPSSVNELPWREPRYASITCSFFMTASGGPSAMICPWAMTITQSLMS